MTDVSHRPYIDVSLSAGESNVTMVTLFRFASSFAMTAVTRCTPPKEKMESTRKQICFISMVDDGTFRPDGNLFSCFRAQAVCCKVSQIFQHYQPTLRLLSVLRRNCHKLINKINLCDIHLFCFFSYFEFFACVLSGGRTGTDNSRDLQAKEIVYGTGKKC